MLTDKVTSIQQRGADPEFSSKLNKEDCSEEYEGLWIKYWNADPDNFLWGINPNDKTPKVVIKQVVFSSKKETPSSNPTTSTNTESRSGGTLKWRPNKISDEEQVGNQEAAGQSRACIVM